MTRDEGHRATIVDALGAHRLRRLGAVLVAFGVVGLLLVGAAVSILVAAGPSLDEVGAVSDRAGPTRRALDDASRALVDLGSSATSLQVTLDASGRSLGDAATASRSLGTALAAVGSAMDIQVLGSRPFASAGDQLRSTSEQMSRVGDDLDALASRLSGHAGEAASIAADAIALRKSVDEIDASLGGPGGIGLAGSIAVIRLVLLGLLAWIGVLAGACVAIGRWLRGAASIPGPGT